MALELRVLAHSEVGLVRKQNQDSGFASPTMLMVADGMGGAAAGDLASRIAVDELFRVDGQGAGEAMLDVLDQAARRANDRLADLIDEEPDLDGMGTTVCGGLFDGRDFGIVHLGDSRGYLVRGTVMLRLTHDHSWVQSLIDEGRLAEQDAFTHPHRSLLLRVLNGQPYSRPDLLLITLKDGDRLLFCTDGLCGLVDDPVIGRGLALPDPEQAMRALVDAAHAAGGSDNITLVLADVIDASPAVLGPASDAVALAPAEETARLDPADIIPAPGAKAAPPQTAPVPSDDGQVPEPSTGDEQASHAPAAAPADNGHVPGPSGGDQQASRSTAPGPADNGQVPGPSNGDRQASGAPVPVPADNNQVSGPSTGDRHDGRGPAPVPADNGQAPGPSIGDQQAGRAPAPGPADDGQTPGPSTGDGRASRAPAPGPADDGQVPGPSTEDGRASRAPASGPADDGQVPGSSKGGRGAAPADDGQVPAAPDADAVPGVAPAPPEASPTSPPGDPLEDTAPIPIDLTAASVATPSERSDTSWAASVWAPLREQIAAAPPLQAEGRPAGEGRLIGAAARTTPLTLAALGEPEPDGGEAAAGPLAPRHRLPRGPSGAPPAVDSEDEEAPEAEAERARYSPTEKKGVRPGVLALVGAIVLVIGLALGGLVLYGRSQYFVGAEDGLVTIFRGLPGDIAGVSTHGVVERADIALVDLPTAWREKLEKGIEQSGLDAARAEVAGLRQIRASCLDERDARVAWEQAQASPTPSPTGTSTSSAAPTSASTGSASPTSATTRSPGATATSSTAPGPSPNPTAVPNPTTPTATATPSPTGPPSPPPTWTDGC